MRGIVYSLISMECESSVLELCLKIFFFQAEDGIRDYKVTGVQTCALPIWFRALSEASAMGRCQAASCCTQASARREGSHCASSLAMSLRERDLALSNSSCRSTSGDRKSVV